MDLSHLVVCSFYTDDEYYRGHADGLRKNLEELGAPHDLKEVHKEDGEDWADICRKKIAFLASVCDSNPDKLVVWIDVDCRLLEIPEYVVNSSADLFGFQRGFGSPMNIGYSRRTRFWEPCFFGIAPSPLGRKFVRDALTQEQAATIKATDDYFFEESWRANAANMTFQILPSSAVFKPDQLDPDVQRPFFSFGSSGNVADFKDVVTQHSNKIVGVRTPLRSRLRVGSLRIAKSVERALPRNSASRLRRIADSLGVTHRLTGGYSGAEFQGSDRRQVLVRKALSRGLEGDVKGLQETLDTLKEVGEPSFKQRGALRAAESFGYYAGREGTNPLSMVWWARPFPGNFGDWLSPLIASHYTSEPILFVPPAAVSREPNLVCVGSIGRFIKSNSVVVGTGISTLDLQLARDARYVSVRGPLTAAVVKESGGGAVTSFGDPGLLLARLLPVERKNTNGRTLLVRHYTHASIPLQLPEDVDELSVLMSHPEDIATFVHELNRYDRVVTSAMHVMIACHSYGIPVALVSFEGFETTVHGSGIKYEDYSRGAGLERIYNPIPISRDMRSLDLESLMSQETVAVAKIDEIESAVLEGIRILSNSRPSKNS